MELSKPEVHKQIVLESSDMVMNFSKHKGKLVANIDRGFWEWVLSKDDSNAPTQQFIKLAL